MNMIAYNRAIAFAREKHEKQNRKGTLLPYIVHIYEVLQLLKEENADDDTIVAGILHDVVEDCGVSIEEIGQIFGYEVAVLVQNESEDKSLDYCQRKKLHMQHIANCSDRTKLINCADKLSNLRGIYLDLQCFGEEVWNRFNGTKNEIKTYYCYALNALKSIKKKKIYKVLKYYFKKVFYDRKVNGKIVKLKSV